MRVGLRWLATMGCAWMLLACDDQASMPGMDASAVLDMSGSSGGDMAVPVVDMNSGNTDLVAFSAQIVLTELKTTGYTGWVTIESFGFSVGKIAAAASIWRDLAPTVDEIAYDGVKFLKKTLSA